MVVEDLERYVHALAGSGWYLLPQSLETIRQARTAWLSRPDMPWLIEVNQATGSTDQGDLSTLELPNPTSRPGLIEALGAEGLITSADARLWLTIGGLRFGVDQLLGRTVK